MNFRNLQWLFPVVVALHNAEEAIWFPGWSKRMDLCHARYSPVVFRFAAAVLTVLAFVITYLSARTGVRTVWTYLAFGYMAAMLANALIPHVAITLARRSYMPGVVTGTLLNLPVLSLLVVLALREGYVSGWKAVGYAVGVSGLLLLSIPVLFKLGSALLATVLAVLLIPGPNASAQPVHSDHPDLKFLGRKVTVIEPQIDEGDAPKGPVSVCLEAPPQRQCYTAPPGFGKKPAVSLVQIERDMPAIFFTAESYGVSGWQIHFALLRPGRGRELEDLFWSDGTVSNQSQYAFWRDPEISDAHIFVTADYVWGPDEGRYSAHRYLVSAHVLKASSFVQGRAYFLEDRYMTVSRYDLATKANILASEKQEILARLRRLKAHAERDR